MQKTFLVIPTIRDLEFLRSWADQLAGVSVVVVEDHEAKMIEVPDGLGTEVFHYTWEDIRADLGEREWIIGRHNSSIRNYGFYKAHQMGAEIIVTLDDDCYPTEDQLIGGHLANLTFKAHDLPWQSTYPGPDWMYTRGFPYVGRNMLPVWVSHGLWSGALDLDGETEVRNGQLLQEKAYQSIRQVIPRGIYYPMCSMNLAFVRDATPLMFFPMMGDDHLGKSWGYDRFDDIWAGILSKKIMDHLGYCVVNGSPVVEHRKKSIPTHNLEKERAGVGVNENFWQWIDGVKLTQQTPVACYIELAEKAAFPDEPYFDKLRQAMRIWAELFE